MQKTKMIFTIGPTSEKEEILYHLIEAGMSAARLNFSHGNHEEHLERINKIKKLRKELNKQIAIVLDTKGPEIRTGNFNETKIELKQGNEFTIVCGEEVLGNEHICSITYANLYEDVKPGNTILIDDGLVGLRVEKIEGNRIKCTVMNNGVVSNHKGVNVPGVSVKLPALTDKDINDLKFGIEQGVDMIAASFIRKASDVVSIRKVLERNGGSDILIFSKIENSEGVSNIDEIIKYSDGIMVARGDMGVEIPIEKVPLVQKMIIDKCNKAGKPVITATQMLDSMMRNPRPTRAEASDVANAIFDGTDAIMLSGETANGKYPVETANTMARIAQEAEKLINHENLLRKKAKVHSVSVVNAISLATCTTAMQLNASAIIVATQTGNSARRMSKYRPECPIIAVTPYENVARRLALNWGVLPIIANKTSSTDELVNSTVDTALQTGYVNKGDLVVIACGMPVDCSGTTNMLKVHIVGDVLVQGKGVGTCPIFGTAAVAHNVKEANEVLQDSNILVLKNLSREYLEVLDRVSAIIAEEGGVTSHLAIECMQREIPLLLNAKDALKIIKTGSFITVDIARGIVYSGKANVK